MDDATRAALIAEGAALTDQVANAERRLKQIKAELVKLEPGEYAADNGRTAQVILPTPAIKPEGPADIAAAREAIGDENIFVQLFQHVRGWKPVKDFRTKASVLLKGEKLRRVLGICEKPGQKYVIFK
jgi:hypothetical protein